MFRYRLNPESEIPIYRQLADQINAEIRSGALKTGTQLPTVREMAERMHLSCGTVKRVYDRLQELGDVEMTRRRGTFVKYVRENSDSRKLQAMTAIDRMIRSLSDLNFSPAEIQIFLNLKMREWGLKWSGIRVAVVTEYAELSAAFEKQLGQIGNLRVNICRFKQLREYPYSVDEQSDVILASPGDCVRLAPLLPDRSKLIKLAFQASDASVAALARARGRIGVLGADDAFFDLVRGYLPEGACACLRSDAREARADFFASVQTLVTAPDFERECDAELAAAIAGCEARGARLCFDYRIDEGSMIYLEERINRIRDERQLHPGALDFKM